MSKPNEINIPAIIEDLGKSGKNAVILEWLDLNNQKQTVTILSPNFYAKLYMFDLLPEHRHYEINRRAALVELPPEYHYDTGTFHGTQLNHAEIEYLVKKLEEFESLDTELKVEYV
jgi:hypothetical protein